MSFLKAINHATGCQRKTASLAAFFPRGAEGSRHHCGHTRPPSVWSEPLPS